MCLTTYQCFGATTSPEAYVTYNQVQDALIGGGISEVPNLWTLADVFFPKGGGEPACVPIKYMSLCHDNSSANVSANYSFLWTQNHIPYSIGILLLSYSKSGITLRGFEWERSCVFMDVTEIALEYTLYLSNCSSKVLNDSLQDLTSQVCECTYLYLGLVLAFVSGPYPGGGCKGVMRNPPFLYS